MAGCLLLGLPAGAGPAPAASAAAPADAGSMWDLSDLYATPEAWSEDLTKTQAAAAALAGYKGTLGRSASAMFSALDAISAVRRQWQRLYVYASLKADEDLRVASNQERRQQSQALGTLLAENTSWVAPEVIALPKPFHFVVNGTMRGGPHTLGHQAASVTAAAGTFLQQPGSVRTLLAS